MAELPGQQFWGKLGIWASCQVCTIVSWSAVGCTTTERFRELLPEDLRVPFILQTDQGGLDVWNLFYSNRAQPADAVWRMFEILLVEHKATLRVELKSAPSVKIRAGSGTPESRVRNLLEQ